MSRSGKFRSVLGRMWKGIGIDLAMDLGTANTLVYLKGKGIVLDEPSVIAIDTRSNRTVAIGKQAQEYLGRSPAWIWAGRPLKNGVIADFDWAMAMIKGFLASVFRPRFWVNPRIVIGIPSGITQVEKRAVKDAAYEAGARTIYLIEEPMAAAMGTGLDVERPKGNLIVDIGGGTTEVAVISLCATTYCESIGVAGDEMDEAIVRYVQKNLHLEISPTTAEAVKIRIGCAIPSAADGSVQVTGKHLGRGGPRTVELTPAQISEALTEPVDAILDAIRRALENSPPALLADIKERGLVLTGGGSQLIGLDRLISTMIGIRAYLADAPLTSVVKGCGMAIEDPTRWKRIFVA